MVHFLVHIPNIGKLIALSLRRLLGSIKTGGEVYEKILCPVTRKLITKYDAAKERGLKIYYKIEDTPLLEN